MTSMTASYATALTYPIDLSSTNDDMIKGYLNSKSFDLHLLVMFT